MGVEGDCGAGFAFGSETVYSLNVRSLKADQKMKERSMMSSTEKSLRVMNFSIW